MKSIRIPLLAIGLALTAAMPALAGPFDGTALPAVQLIIDGTSYTVKVDRSEAGWEIPNQEFSSSAANGNGAMVSLSGILNPDPSIAYAVAITDFGTASTFGFLFLTPIVPTGAPNTVSGSLVGGITDFTGNGVSLTPSPGPLAQTASVGAPSTSMGVDVGPAFIAPLSTAPGAFYTYGAFAAGPIAGPGPGPWTTLSVALGFTGSGSGDVYALTGFASINPIPEPGTWAMLVAGLGLLGVIARRRLRAA